MATSSAGLPCGSGTGAAVTAEDELRNAPSFEELAISSVAPARDDAGEKYWRVMSKVSMPRDVHDV